MNGNTVFTRSPITRIIKYVSAKCGEGKTYSVCKNIVDTISDCNYLYVAPTIELVQQFSSMMEREFDLNCITLHTNNSENVKANILSTMECAGEHGTALAITWAAFQELGYRPGHKNFKVYVDEVPQLDQLFEMRVPYNTQLFEDYLKILPFNDALGLVAPRDRGKLRYFLEKKCLNDDVYSIYYDLFKAVYKSEREVYVDWASWERLCEEKVVSSHQDGNVVYFLSLLSATLFRGVTLLGANIEQSMMYLWLSKNYGMSFEKDSEIYPMLRRGPALGSRVRILYCIHGKKWSKTLGKKTDDNGLSVYSAIEQAVIDTFGNAPFLLVVNNGYQGQLSSLTNAERIPVDTKGINCYKKHDKIAILPALNRAPKHMAMLRELGIPNDCVDISTGLEMVYQCAMRTSLRDPSSTRTVDIIVPTNFEADFLIEMFGEGTQKRHISDLEFVEYKPLSAVQMNSRHKAKKVSKQYLPVGVSKSEENSQNGEVLPYSFKATSNHNRSHNFTPNSQGCYLTFHADTFAKREEHFEQRYIDFTQFGKDMKVISRNIVSKKTEGFMVNSSVYEVPENYEGYRRGENFVASSMLVLDFDGGNLSIQNFEDIFWHKAGRGRQWTFIICNSFSRSSSDPNRFRVFMPFSDPVFCIDQYGAVYDSILRRLEGHGYTEESMKLDRNSRSPIQSYWMPCTNRLFPECAYFNKFGFKKKELKQCLINPSNYSVTQKMWSNAEKVVPVNGSEKAGMSPSEKQAKISAIRSEYQAIPSGSGNRNNAFYVCGLKLSNYMSLADVESQLTQLAGGESKILGRIPGVIASIEKRRANEAA